jgi:hypothetical protein
MIKVTHNAGFFSCCTIRLQEIVNFINYHHNLPIVDSSTQFEWYKIKPGDITYDYFEKNDINISINHINYHSDHQYLDYSRLDYNIIPLIKKYFSPSLQIINIMNTIEKKYNLDYKNICVLFNRGNDKITETPICSYDEYIQYANEVLAKNPNITFLLQSDETEFIETMTQLFPNSFYFKDEIRHMNKCNNTVDIVFKAQNHIYSKYYLAITILMSKCKYIICGSGNCSIWIMFYRGNCKNVYQYLNDKFIYNDQDHFHKYALEPE